MSQPSNIYRELQQRLDTMSLGYPATESGIELQILRRLFSEDDARLFLALTQRLKAPEEIAAELGQDPEELEVRLRDMRDRGLLFSVKKGDVTRYATIAFVHGIMEFQVNRLDRDLSEMLEAYFDEAFGDAIAFSTPTFVRTLPVQESVETSSCHVAPFDDAAHLFRTQKVISVADCICRKEHALLGRGCGKPREVCFMFGSMGQYYIDQGLGRKIDADEAIRLLAEAQKAGLVTQPGTAQNPGGICNCCGDCCSVLRALDLLEKPAEQVSSQYYCTIDRDLCTGCELCIDRCQVHALAMEDDRASINPDRCIGCGLCVTECPTEALKLVPKAKQTPLPAATAEQMAEMARARGLL